jgi:hypothetical protein
VADAFRARFAQAPAEWSRAAAAFRSGRRRGRVLLGAGRGTDAGGHGGGAARAGNAAAERAHAPYTAAVDLYLARPPWARARPGIDAGRHGDLEIVAARAPRGR